MRKTLPVIITLLLIGCAILLIFKFKNKSVSSHNESDSKSNVTVNAPISWINKFASNEIDAYVAEYEYEAVCAYVSGRQDLYFNTTIHDDMVQNGSMGVGVLKTYNKYDIMNVVGENKIREVIGRQYDEYLEEGANPDLSREEFLNNYIAKISANYNKNYESTDFNYYIDDNVVVFSKDLKADDTVLEYVSIMPVNMDIDSFVSSLNIEKINLYVEKTLEDHAYDEGYVTIVYGEMPMFKLENNITVTGVDSSKLKDFAGLNFTHEGIKTEVSKLHGEVGGLCSGWYDYKVPIKRVDLTMSKPFVYIIRDKNTKDVWYIGKVLKGLSLPPDEK